MKTLLILLIMTLNSQAKHYLMYEQFSAEMGYYRINFQCKEKSCESLKYYKNNLMGKKAFKKDIVDGIKANFFANFLKIKEPTEKNLDTANGICPDGESIIFKYYRNYGEKELIRCFIKDDYYATEFQQAFTKVYQSIPPVK